MSEQAFTSISDAAQHLDATPDSTTRPSRCSGPPLTPRILITGVGGPSGVCLLRALAGRPVELLAGDIDPYAAGLYLVDAERRLMLPRGDDPRFVELVLELCACERVDVLVPTVDSELIPLAAARARFQDAGVSLVLAPLATLEVCLDKWALHARCRDRVRTPETALVSSTFDPATAPLPAIVKPRTGSGSRGIRQVVRAEEYEHLNHDCSLLVQELLPGAEYSLDVLATRAGRVIAVVPRERLKIDSGIAVTSRTLHDERLQTIGREVAERIGLTGVANVQVKIAADGEPALLEVNPRFPGTMALTVASGVDMPWLCVADALGQAMPDEPFTFEDVAMVRFFQERFMPFAEISSLQDRVIEPDSDLDSSVGGGVARKAESHPKASLPAATPPVGVPS
jgi:carbamoyl-phosphate synthase large subunit